MAYSRHDVDRSSELQDRLIEIYEDPVAFGALWHRGVPTPSGRRKVYSKLHRDIADHALSANKTSTVVARNHGKTTFFGDLALWEKWREIHTTTMYASAATGLAKMILGDIKTIMLGADCELFPGVKIPFSACFPELMPVRAASGSPLGSFNCAGANKAGVKEPCFFPAAPGSNKAGLHPDRIYADDLINEKTGTTPEQIQKSIDFMKQMVPILKDQTHGKIRQIGTLWAPYDVNEMLRRNPMYTQFRFGCWDGVNPDTGQQDGKGPGPDGGWPLCPAFMTADELYDQEREIDDPVFWGHQYLIKATPAAYALFKEELLEEITIPWDIDQIRAKIPGVHILLWDPTQRTDPKVGDYNGIAVVFATTAEHCKAAALTIPGLADMPDDTTLFFIAHAAEIQGQPSDCLPLIEELHRRYQYETAWVENNGPVDMIRSWMHEQEWGADVEFLPITISTKAKKDHRLQGLQMGMKKHRVLMPKKFPGQQELVQRLVEYPKSTSDDLPDALSLLTNGLERRNIIPGIPQAQIQKNVYDIRNPAWPRAQPNKKHRW